MWINYKNKGYNSKGYCTSLPPLNDVPVQGSTFNRFELFEAMVNRTLVRVGGVLCRVQGIALEDGSGHNFNVTLLVGNKTHIVYVKG